MIVQRVYMYIRCIFDFEICTFNYLLLTKVFIQLIVYPIIFCNKYLLLYVTVYESFRNMYYFISSFY